MPSITVEPFTSAVLVANVDRVSSLGVIHEGADSVSSGEGDSVGSQWQEKPSMQGPDVERWQELCREAATEQDPKRLMELTAEIIRLLNEKEQRLLAKRKHDDLNGSEPTHGAA
jgi:hypothetical protein